MKLMEADVELLVQFFLHEYANDAVFVDEWLDNTGRFETEEDREDFIRRLQS